jgi:hypothetical protein
MHEDVEYEHYVTPARSTWYLAAGRKIVGFIPSRRMQRMQRGTVGEEKNKIREVSVFHAK